MVGGGEGKDGTASMARRIRELEEQLGIRKKEGAALPSSHRHASSTRSDREEGGGKKPTRTAQCMDQVVDGEAFLTAAFQTGDGPFLSVKVTTTDAPFVNVLLSPGTPWQGRPRDIERSEIVSRMRGETDIFEEMTPISRVPYAFARTTTPDMAHAARRVNSYYHLLTYPMSLSKRKLKILTSLMTGDEGVVFMFPDSAARTFLTHVIAVSLWPKDPLCAFNLE
jgi:hypothetical protein